MDFRESGLFHGIGQATAGLMRVVLGGSFGTGLHSQGRPSTWSQNAPELAQRGH